jgi:hypothetical protein
VIDVVMMMSTMVRVICYCYLYRFHPIVAPSRDVGKIDDDYAFRHDFYYYYDDDFLLTNVHESVVVVTEILVMM